MRFRGLRFGPAIVLLLLLAIVLSACGGETLDPWDSKGNLREITDLSSGAKEDLIKVSTGIFQVRTEATRDDSSSSSCWNASRQTSSEMPLPTRLRPR